MCVDERRMRAAVLKAEFTFQKIEGRWKFFGPILWSHF